MIDRPTAPGLKWRPRKGGAVPYWVASGAAVRAGFQPKAVRLNGDAAAIVARAERLHAEMVHFLGRGGRLPAFDGTWRALFDFYEREADSPFHKLKPSSRHPYLVYLRKLVAHIGARRIDQSDGRDVRRWFDVWAAPAEGGQRKVAAARMALYVLEAALSWGIQCRKPGCAEFRLILDQMQFETPKPRTAAPTAADVERIRTAAHAAGAPSRALAYALQFETTLRQWDVIGEWLPLGDPRPSAVLGPAGKWIGLQWSHVGADNVARYTPSKTDGTSGAEVVADLNLCPMVLAELARMPPAARSGSLIVCEATGRPYIYETFRGGWRRDFKAAGIPKGVWGRDLRAGGISEGSKAGASKDDLKRIGGHSERSRSAEVYDRAALDAHRRVALARKAFRDGGEGA